MFSAEASKYIGRVGALAIALGIGGAVATPPWLASADETGSSSAANPRGRDNTASTHRASRVRSVPATGVRRAPVADNLPAAVEVQRNSNQQPSGSVPSTVPGVSVARVDIPSTSRAVPKPAVAYTAPGTPAAEAPGPLAPAATASAASTAPVAQAAPVRVVAQPAAAVAATGQLSVPSPSPSGKSTSAPTGPLDFFTAALSLVSREINRLIFNQTPTAKPVLTSQTNPVITGSVVAFDPNGDQLAYAVIQAPAQGSVVVDADGNFTYTANPDLAAAGGADTFVFQVRDTGFHLNFWTPTTISVPMTLNVLVPQADRQVSAARTASPAAAATTTPGTGSVTYSVGDNWGAGFIGNMAVTAGPSGLKGWTVSFTTPAQITNLWNGVISSHVGDAYVVTNAPWNGQLAAGQSAAIGFQASTGSTGTAVTGLQLNGVAVVAPTTPPGISVAGVTAAEPSGTGTAQAAFAVTLSKASTTPVSIRYATANGTATAGVDYTATAGTLTFAPGVTSQQINVPILADTAVEAGEAFTVTLSNPTGATITGATATGTITNTPPAVTPTAPTVSVANVTVAEPTTGTAQAAFTVTLSKASTTPVTIRYATANGTATAGADYTATTGTLTFAPGVTAQQINVPILADTAVEAGEAFTVTLSNPTGATITGATATATITNTAVTPSTGTGTTYSITATGPDIVGFNPAKDKLDLGDVSVHNFIVVDTPEGVGFRSPWTGETAVLQGVSLGQLTVDNFAPIINDHLRQDLSGALAWEHGITAAPNTVYVRSHEVGQVDTAAFNPATDVVDFRYYGTREQIYLTDSPDGVILGNAGTGQALILKGVTKSQLTQTNFVFHFAQAREDSLYKQLGFASITDAQIKPQGVPIAGTTVWPTAAGNGTPPTGQTGTTTVIAWKNGTDTPLTFDPSKDKLDFGWFKAPEFDVTDTSGSTKITIVGNNQTYTLTGVTLGQLQTGNIIALDSGARTKWQNLIFTATPTTPLPSLSVADRSAAEGNTGTSNMNFTVLLSKAATKAVTVGYTTSTDTATAGDFTPTVGTLTFAPGETSKIVSVAISGDTMYELNEQFTLNLSNASNATIADATAIGIITNDDINPSPATPPKVSIADLAVTEGNGEHSHLMFTATLDKASATPVSVAYATSNGTATAGVDYTAEAGTITFAAGVTTQTVHVGIIGDTAIEPNETFTVTLSAPSGLTIARGTAVGTITNDDVAVVVTPPTVSVADASVSEGNSGSRSLAFTATLSKSSATTVTVNYVTSNGTATAGQDYTAGSGTITFAPGVVSQTVNVAVIGDTAVEPIETFTVTLSSPSGATLARAAAIGTILTDDITSPVGGTTAQWGNAFFAPYVDMAGWPVPDLVAMSKATGASLFTLGFLQADANGNPAWGSYTVLEPTSTNDQAVAINTSIAALRAAGGDVMISFGGVAGTSLAQSYAARGLSAQALANAYAGVIDTYGVTHLDFDIEGAAIGDAASIALNSSALKLLQQSRPTVQIWYTLPVLPQGLTTDGINVVQSALTAGVKLAGVNVMAMDYGEGPAPTTGPNAQTMGTYAIQSAQSTYTQLSSLYTKNGQTFGWNQIGVTPMIGVNDITSEVFTVADAQALNAFAVAKGLGMIGYWSVERDYPGTLGQPTHNASGVSSPAGSFSNAWNKYGTINIVNNGGGTITPPTVTPGLSISDASATEPGSGGMAPGFLRTSGNQIIDSQGKTVQISGVNWFGMESTTQAPHGLWTRSYKEMINEMAGLGFNTIRLPYSSELLHTTAAPNGIDFSKNADLQGLSGVQVMDAIIAYAGQQGMRVILDHHRSGAGAGTSDNGLWYDSTYTEDAWVADWVTLANRYKTNSTVIGFDLHNEPHSGVWGGGGATDWARAAERAGNAALAVNPNLLMFVEGVESYQGQNYWWGGNLMGVKDRPIVFNVANRLVYSPHDYPNSVFPQTWFQTADFGAGLPAVFRKAWGYIYEQNIAPVYIGEFGTKLVDPKDAIWLEAITSYISGDLDNNGTRDIATGNQGINWTFWSWNPNSGDTGGILADDWKTVNQNKMAYLTPVQFSTAGGSSLAAFTVSLNSASTSAVTVGFSTSNGTATAGSDYIATSGTLTFAPGETSKTIAIIVNGDATAEAKETFTVTLSNPSGATLVDGSGAGSITDRATTPAPPVTPVTPVTPVALPKVSIADLAVVEGNGEHAHFMFVATLDSASATPVSVGYATANGTATAGVDYTAETGTITFAPGVTTQSFHVGIIGDTAVEPVETLTVTLSNPTGATIARATAIGSILNDDLAAVTPTPPTTGANYVDIMTFGMFHGSSHTGMDALEGGRTAITTEAVVAYNDLRRFAGLAPTTIDDVGRWAFANSMTNNAEAWGTDVQGVGLYYAMQGAKVGWIADGKYTPQVVADIERAARLGSAADVMAMVAQYGHVGYAKYLIDNGYQTAFINTLKMEPHYGGWMHDRANGRLIIDGAATAHDVNHLTILSHDQTQPFMNDTWDYPQWPALNVPNKKVIEYFQSMVALGDPRGTNLTALDSPTTAAVMV